jgi:acyl-CoA synthetase (AMP-forming)/AMP-acid ligase II
MPVLTTPTTPTNTGMGMGNYLWRTLEADPDARHRVVFTRPVRTGWGDTTGSLTLAELATLADGYARRYVVLGVGRGEPVGVYVDHGAKYLVHFLALTRIGAIAVLVNERMPTDMAGRYLASVGVAGVFTDETRRSALAGIGARFGFVVVEDDFASIPAGADVVAHRHVDDDPVLITHSSGTTGVPKAVVLEHDAFFFPVFAGLTEQPAPPTRRVLSALPQSHNAAMTAAATSIATGRELFLMSASDGLSVLRAIQAHRPTSVVAFPHTYVDLLASGPEHYDLSSVSMWFNLGDAAHESHIRELMRFGNHERDGRRVAGSQFVDGLGSSEVGSTVFSIVHSPGTRHFGRCVGLPRPWVDAVTLNPDGSEAEPGSPGLIGIRSPSLFAGYWNDSRRTYASRLAGYFLTGDVAVRDARGRFFHLDRVTDTVHTRHGPLHTLRYEEVLLSSVEELLDCAVIALRTEPDEAYSVCLAVPRDATTDPGLLRARVAAALSAAGLQPVTETRVIERGELRVGVTGKVLKAELREVLRRELDRAGQTSREEDDDAG